MVDEKKKFRVRLQEPRTFRLRKKPIKINNLKSENALKSFAYFARFLTLTIILILTILYFSQTIDYSEVFSNSKDWFLENSFLVIFIFLILSLLIIWLLPKWQTRNLDKQKGRKDLSDFERNEKRLKLIDDKRKTLAQILGGVLLLLGFAFTYNSFQLTKETQYTERFSKAITHLGDEKLEVRLGGLYELERLAKDSSKDHWTVVEVVSAYVRERTQKRENKSKNKYIENNTNKFLTDVQVALTVIGRRQEGYGRFFGTVDLSNLDLRGADFSFGNFRNTKFDRSDLRGAKFFHTNFALSTFLEADLEGNDLISTNLNSANLNRANLKKISVGTTMMEANGIIFTTFEDAIFASTDLRGASLNGAIEVNSAAIESAIIDEYTVLPFNLDKVTKEKLVMNSKEREKKLEQYKKESLKITEKNKSN